MSERCASPPCPRYACGLRRLCEACYQSLPFAARLNLTSDLPAFRLRAMNRALELLATRASGDKAFRSKPPHAR